MVEGIVVQLNSHISHKLTGWAFDSAGRWKLGQQSVVRPDHRWVVEPRVYYYYYY